MNGGASLSGETRGDPTEALTRRVVTNFSSELAPLTWPRKRDGFNEGWEDWLLAFQGKRAPEWKRSRRLVRFLTQAKMADDEIHALLGCRQSRRISPSAYPVSSELGFARASKLQPIEEIFESEDERAQKSDSAVVHVRDSSSVSGEVEAQPPRCSAVISPLPSPLEVSTDACVVELQDGSAPIETKEDGRLLADASHQSPIEGVSSPHPFLLMNSSFTAEQGVDCSADQSFLNVGDMVEVVEERVDSVEFEDGQLLHVAGGMAVKLSPTDGRQQPLPLPAAPMVVEGVGHGGCGAPKVCGQRDFPRVGDHQGFGGDIEQGGGMASVGESRTYASAVRSDRRSDVRHHFVPSVTPEDGDELCMMDSDRDEMEWEVCLVGHFLQSGVPFSMVRQRLLHLWRAEGLVEVRSLDAGFYLFRFSGLEGRDKVLEGGRGL
ncbi:hypothetical protein Dimus_030404 [Dionaea muscipula]